MTDRDLDRLLGALREELAVRPSEVFAARVRTGLARRRSVGRRRLGATGLVALLALAGATWSARTVGVPHVPVGWGADRGHVLASHWPVEPAPIGGPDVRLRAAARAAAIDIASTPDHRPADLRHGLFDPFKTAPVIEAAPLLVELRAPTLVPPPRPLFRPVEFPAVGVSVVPNVYAETPAEDRPGPAVTLVSSTGRERK